MKRSEYDKNQVLRKQVFIQIFLLNVTKHMFILSVKIYVLRKWEESTTTDRTHIKEVVWRNFRVTRVAPT